MLSSERLVAVTPRSLDPMVGVYRLPPEAITQYRPMSNVGVLPHGFTERPVISPLSPSSVTSPAELLQI